MALNQKSCFEKCFKNLILLPNKSEPGANQEYHRTLILVLPKYQLKYLCLSPPTSDGIQKCMKKKTSNSKLYNSTWCSTCSRWEWSTTFSTSCLYYTQPCKWGYGKIGKEKKETCCLERKEFKEREDEKEIKKIDRGKELSGRFNLATAHSYS